MKKTHITIQSDNDIYLADMTDQHNMPRAYNTKKRGLKKAHEYITKNIEQLETMSMYQVMTILDDNYKLGMRSYCAMD